MSRIVLETKPCRCCGRCGVKQSEARRLRLPCIAFGGIRCNQHTWVWWVPPVSEVPA